MGNPSLTKLRSDLTDLAERIKRQAECLVAYAEQNGEVAKPVPSVYHLQAGHFFDLAAELNLVAESTPHGAR